ncbi:hypothetical protein NL676_029576 [Syzygium grande]|nr:hypothetical protein NL676_029576 [Syzygium grande]
MHVDCRQSPPSLICPIPHKPVLVVAPSVLSFVVASGGHALPWLNSHAYTVNRPTWCSSLCSTVLFSCSSEPSARACWIAVVDLIPFTGLLQEVYTE